MPLVLLVLSYPAVGKINYSQTSVNSDHCSAKYFPASHLTPPPAPQPQVNSRILHINAQSTKPKIKVDPSAHFFFVLSASPLLHILQYLYLQIIATLAFPISKPALQFRVPWALEFSSLYCRLEIAFWQESRMIRRLTSFLLSFRDQPSYSAYFQCLQTHLTLFVSYFSC